MSKAQEEASKRWKDKNREKQRIYQNRSAARRFIRDMATPDDLAEIKKLVRQRERDIQEEKEKKL